MTLADRIITALTYMSLSPSTPLDWKRLDFMGDSYPRFRCVYDNLTIDISKKVIQNTHSCKYFYGLHLTTPGSAEGRTVFWGSESDFDPSRGKDLYSVASQHDTAVSAGMYPTLSYILDSANV